MTSKRSSLLFALALAGCIAPTTAESATPEEEAAEQGDDTPPPIVEGDHNMIRNSDFEEGSASPWGASTSGTAIGRASIEDGAYCMDLQARGETAWDAQIRHRQLRVFEGHKYLVEFTAFASEPTRVRPKVGMAGPPYDEYWASIIEVDTQPKRYTGHFTMTRPDDKLAELTFQLAGPLAPEDGTVKVCFDDIALHDPEFQPPPPPAHLAGPRVRVNQVGYFPERGKRATYKTKDYTSRPWQLLNADEQSVFEGMTHVFGEDKASGDLVHVIDFSNYTTPGRDYRIKVDDQTSYPFDIRPDIYADLKLQAVHFFYHQRSGIPITMPYAGQAKWTRAAGHVSDDNIECLPDLKCGFTMDVHGGWYDAGDHGKYVVNGGITVWTLLNMYERAKYLGAGVDAWADGKLAIPENKNGVNDLLDEVRYELEFELRMQIPDDAPKWQGMAFHKLHELQWTAMPKAPHETNTQRFLHRPSTTATLNLAANAAQGARIWKDIDPTFSNKLLVAAERAWEAAQRNPNMLAPGSDNVGGGPYDDLQVHDEFYWAAVELYLTTKKPAYADFARKSQDYLEVSSGAQSPFNWQLVHVLGTISIATVPGFEPAEVKKARAALVAAADAYTDIIVHEGYRTALTSGGGNTYPWGSNSLLLNNMVILGLAYDFTKKPKYRQGVIDGLDYLLGRNAMSQSYVTGYGEVPLKNPHHRFWAFQLDESYPEPPPGIVSGGPNSALQDPYAQTIGLPGCPPQKCFVDHIESWSTNEIAINWNSPFAWVVAFLDETAR